MTSATAGIDTVAAAVTHRVQGLLWRAIAGGRVSADEATSAAARDAHLAALRTCLLAEETAVLACSALDGGGVAARVLKGAAVARLDHDDPAERVFGDADVLIGRADHARALTALSGAGFVRSEPPIRAWWERRFGKAIVLHGPNGGELDLHLSLTGGYFGAVLDSAAALGRVGDEFVLAGRPMSALDRHDRLLHACCHSVLGGASGLRAQRDIAQLLLMSGASWEVAADRAGEADVVVAAGIVRAWASLGLGGHEAVEWARSFSATDRQRDALATYTAAFGSTWAPEGRGVLAALHPKDRVLFAAGLAFPSRASLQFRRRTLLSHLRHVVGAAR